MKPLRVSKDRRFRRTRYEVFANSEDGSTLLEAALSLTAMLTVMLTIIGASRVAYAKHFVAFAARQGTRYAMVRGSSYAANPCSAAGAYACQATAASIRAYVLANVPLGLSASAVTVTTSWPGVAASGLNCLSLNGTNSPGCDVQVTVAYNFRYHLPFLPVAATSFQATSVMPIMR